MGWHINKQAARPSPAAAGASRSGPSGSAFRRTNLLDLPGIYRVQPDAAHARAVQAALRMRETPQQALSEMASQLAQIIQ